MRKPEGKYVLKAYSLKEIRSAFERELLRVRDTDVQATEQVMARAHLVNAVFLWYLGQPESVRDAIVLAGTEDLRKRIESDDPLPLVLPGDAPAPPEATRGRGLGGVTLPGKSQKRKAQRADLPATNNN